MRPTNPVATGRASAAIAEPVRLVRAIVVCLAAALVSQTYAQTDAQSDKDAGETPTIGGAIQAALQREIDPHDPLLSRFLAVLDSRATADHAAVIDALTRLLEQPADSVLVDDARYLLAHTLVLERYDFAAARPVLERLLAMPEGEAYRDAATYLLAIALEQLGDTDAAREQFVRLRERHTAAELPFGYRWPASGVMSRYWFRRADRRLAMLDRRRENASAIGATAQLADGRLRVLVNTDGIDLTLLLAPSGLVETTEWRDETERHRAPPAAAVYAGVVEGDAGSWVRAVIEEGAIRGLAYAHGRYFRLHPGDLTGTLDYYRPAPALVSGENRGDHLASLLQLDTLMAPPAARSPERRRGTGTVADIRRVPLSIVVDSQFDRYHGGQGLARALTHLNIADGIYRRYGLSLALAAAVTVDKHADPFVLGAVPLERSLRTLRAYRQARREAFDDSALVYLFTGNPKSDVTLGLAWIDTLCRDDGYDVGVTTPLAEGGLLLAHELGHSFGARHDTETACADERDAIMWPEVSARTETRFSSCSETPLESARERVCLSDGVDLSLELADTDGSLLVTVRHSDSRLLVDADLSLETSVPGAIDWPEDCRPYTPGSASCRLTGLRPGEHRRVELRLAGAPLDGSLVLSAHVEPRRYGEVDPADNRGSLTLDAIAVAGPPLPVAAHPSDRSIETESPAEVDRSGGGGLAPALALSLPIAILARRLCRRRHTQTKRNEHQSR